MAQELTPRLAVIDEIVAEVASPFHLRYVFVCEMPVGDAALGRRLSDLASASASPSSSGCWSLSAFAMASSARRAVKPAVVMIEDVSASTAWEHLEKESEDRGSFDVHALQFSAGELDQFQSVFKVFDRDRSGGMQVSELSSALIWLGFPITSEQISSLYEGNDIDGNGTLGEAEFLRCLETLYEDEAEGIRRFLEETDGRCQNGGQLLELLEELGYVDASDAILDALRESNVNFGKRPPLEISEDLPLDLGADELSNVLLSRMADAGVGWLLQPGLCKLRAREGFTDAEMRELKEAFQMQTSGKCEEIACPAIQKALRWLGHSYAFEVVQHFVGELDVDCDGRLDFTLFVKLIRKCRDLERRAATAAFHRLDALGFGFLDDGKQCQAFQSLGCLDAVGNPPPRSLAECSSADLPTFLNIVQRYKFSASRLRELRMNAGYSELELAALRTHFQRFDKDGNGVLRKSELVQLMEELFPRHSNQREFRPYFIQLLGYADADKNDCLDFPEFVRMIRKISDHMEEQNYECFNKSLDELRFTTKEAAEFRGLFLQADQSGTCMLSFADVKSMIARCCVLDAEQSTKLLGFCRSSAAVESLGCCCWVFGVQGS
ncbi:CPK22 [Symbiodinium sp. CCMP2592]|nr:CPK22 [Symbiodinium sp. CCMP2592]